MTLSLHHIAIICSNYPRSKHFYTHVLGFTQLAEHYRPQRNSYKLDLVIGDPKEPDYHSAPRLELFSFANPPPRPTNPEARGLRHLALLVPDLDAELARLATHGITAEPIRTDEYTGQRFTFIRDPDELPIELYETAR
ncbi:MAG: hypothetical protein GC200_08575 [Tepidisphaera sp.]|nr:hypothetical protein [Tepidisphaera sp.]